MHVKSFFFFLFSLEGGFFHLVDLSAVVPDVFSSFTLFSLTMLLHLSQLGVFLSGDLTPLLWLVDMNHSLMG